MNYMDSYEMLRKKEGMLDCSLSFNQTDFIERIYKTCTSNEIAQAINRYPTQIYERFKTYLSKRYNGKNFFLGSGSEDIIWKINSILLNRKKVGVVIPNFYRIYESLNSPIYVEIPIEEKDSILSINIIKKALDCNELEAIWISNPNPITGQCFKVEDLLELIMNFPEILFIVDEVSMDTVVEEEKYSLLLQNKDFLNLIIIRSTSKLYGMPGARLGYANMNKDFLLNMNEESAVFPISAFSVLIAEKVMSNITYWETVKEKIKSNRVKLQRLITNSVDLSFIPSETNILSIKCKNKEINLWKILVENKVLSYSIEEERGIEERNIIRLTIPSEANKFNKLKETMESIINCYQL